MHDPISIFMIPRAGSNGQAFTLPNEVTTICTRRQLWSPGQSQFLSSFPNELLSRIVHLIDDPKDLLSFGLTCKAFWAHISQTLLFETDARFHRQENQKDGSDFHTTKYRIPSILWVMSLNPDLDIVKNVIDVYAKIDPFALKFGWASDKAKPGKKLTPLAIAICKGRLEVVRHIISKGVDVDVKMADPFEKSSSDIRYPPFAIACRAKHQAIAVYLLDGQTVGSPHLSHAIRWNCDLVVREILKRGPFLGDDRMDLIENAILPDEDDHPDILHIDEWIQGNIGKAMLALINCTEDEVIEHDWIMGAVIDHMKGAGDPDLVDVFVDWCGKGRPGIEILKEMVILTADYL